MFYGYETESGRNYVRSIWQSRPTDEERGALEVLEVDHDSAPSVGFWRVDIEARCLVECPGSEEQCVRRRARLLRKRGLPDEQQGFEGDLSDLTHQWDAETGTVVPIPD